MDERSPIAGIGPISVDPDMQNSGAGRAMMQHMLERVAANGFSGVRLVQTAYHNRSFSLYAKLGFEIREPLSVMIGPPIREAVPGYYGPAATDADLDACNRLCFGRCTGTIAAANCVARSPAERPRSISTRPRHRLLDRNRLRGSCGRRIE